MQNLESSSMLWQTIKYLGVVEILDFTFRSTRCAGGVVLRDLLFNYVYLRIILL